MLNRKRKIPLKRAVVAQEQDTTDDSGSDLVISWDKTDKRFTMERDTASKQGSGATNLGWTRSSSSSSAGLSSSSNSSTLGTGVNPGTSPRFSSGLAENAMGTCLSLTHPSQRTEGQSTSSSSGVSLLGGTATAAGVRGSSVTLSLEEYQELRRAATEMQEAASKCKSETKFDATVVMTNGRSLGSMEFFTPIRNTSISNITAGSAVDGNHTISSIPASSAADGKK